MRISVVITTRDRADDLRETVRSLGNVVVPDKCEAELLIVDNASQDHTPAVIAEAALPNMTVRGLHEPKPGQSNARNLALLESRGDILVFTDDDLRYSPDWLEAMAGPLLRGEADAATGAMQIAPHLERPWMEPLHRMWLAAPPEGTFASLEMVGANMAFWREVLTQVPRFDPELGPGALGFADDTLFGYQIQRAGYRLQPVPLRAEHHFLPERLTRASYLSHAKKLGMSWAYVAHHWDHRSARLARWNLLRKMGQLAVWRGTHRAEVEKTEGMHPAEMHHLRSLHIYGHSLIERRRPRNYEQYGLVKKTSV